MEVVVIMIYVLSGLLCCALSSASSSATKVRVEATAPVNPVEEGGIFSFRCQVWNLDPKQELAMVRIPEGGSTERLALQDDVVSDDERIFLATRQLEDSSMVYFLSIMRVQKSDAAEYICAVYGDNDGSFAEVTRQSIQARIMYFPDESEPQCEPQGNIDILAGTELVLNCSSEAAFPSVTLTWSKRSSDAIVDAKQITENGKTYSVLKINPMQPEPSLIYLCTVSSTVFPEKTSSCHIGPITIRRNPNLSTNDQVFNHVPTVNHKDDSQDDKPKLVEYDEGAGGVIKSACTQECSYTNSSAFYWVIATVIAAILAVLFFIIGIVVLIKYCRLHETRKTEYTIARQRNDQQIYAELDSRRGEKVYMYLDKNPKIPLTYTTTPNKDLPEHYGIIPHVQKSERNY